MASRDEMSQALHEFYKNAGVDNVTAEMIEAGIAAYEENRFKYRAPTGGVFFNSFTELVINLYAKRFKVAAIFAISILAIFSVSPIINSASKSLLKAHVSNFWHEVEDNNKSLIKTNKDIRNHLSENSSSSLNKSLSEIDYAKLFAERELSKVIINNQSLNLILKSLVDLHGDNKSLKSFNPSDLDRIKKEWRDSVQENANKAINLANEKITKNNEILKVINEIILLESEFKLLTSTHLFKEKSLRDDVSEIADRVAFSLAIGDAKDASAGLDYLRTVVAQSDRLRDLRKKSIEKDLGETGRIGKNTISHAEASLSKILGLGGSKQREDDSEAEEKKPLIKITLGKNISDKSDSEKIRLIGEAVKINEGNRNHEDQVKEGANKEVMDKDVSIMSIIIPAVIISTIFLIFFALALELVSLSYALPVIIVASTLYIIY